MAYEEQGRQIAADLSQQHGKLLEVRLESKSPCRIVLKYARGELVLPSNFIFQFGYSGSGPSCFHAFLEASGFSISRSQVETAEEGVTLRP
ncbi:MAG: hypothetical protein LJE95_02460 [Acidobacteria bacterium]|nr:hypothetical protein [Acidobacteriota bacterium]